MMGFDKDDYSVSYKGQKRQIRCPVELLPEVKEYISNWAKESIITQNDSVEPIECKYERVSVSGVETRCVNVPRPIFENVRAMINNWKLNGGKPNEQ
jgi:hypothetical protein